MMNLSRFTPVSCKNVCFYFDFIYANKKKYKHIIFEF